MSEKIEATLDVLPFIEKPTLDDYIQTDKLTRELYQNIGVKI